VMMLNFTLWYIKFWGGRLQHSFITLYDIIFWWWSHTCHSDQNVSVEHGMASPLHIMLGELPSSPGTLPNIIGRGLTIP
jgi:hypothetical protein